MCLRNCHAAATEDADSYRGEESRVLAQIAGGALAVESEVGGGVLRLLGASELCSLERQTLMLSAAVVGLVPLVLASECGAGVTLMCGYDSLLQTAQRGRMLFSAESSCSIYLSPKLVAHVHLLHPCLCLHMPANEQ